MPAQDWKLPSVMMRYTLYISFIFLYSSIYIYIYIYIYIKINKICSFIFPFSLVKLRLIDETVALDSGRPGTEFTLCCY